MTPVGGGLVASLPAMDCYLNVMKGPVNGTGGPLTFDSSACYGSSAAPSATTGCATEFNRRSSLTKPLVAMEQGCSQASLEMVSKHCAKLLSFP